MLLITYRLTFLCASADRYGYFFAIRKLIILVFFLAIVCCLCATILSSVSESSLVAGCYWCGSFRFAPYFVMLYCFLIYLFNLNFMVCMRCYQCTQRCFFFILSFIKTYVKEPLDKQKKKTTHIHTQTINATLSYTFFATVD